MNNPSNTKKLSVAVIVVCAALSSACSTTAQRFDAPTAVATNSLERVSLRKERGYSSQPGANVVVMSANPNKRFVLRPLGEGSEDIHTELANSDYIRVIGSYFPKVVYTSPQLNAKLLMRVAPGTHLPLEKLNDGWYRVSTDKGVGFLRTIDGEPTRAEG